MGITIGAGIHPEGSARGGWDGISDRADGGRGRDGRKMETDESVSRASMWDGSKRSMPGGGMLQARVSETPFCVGRRVRLVSVSYWL